MQPNVTQESLDLIKAAQGRPDQELMKAFTQPGSAITGLNAYDLRAPAYKIYPVITPLRNMIPRDASGKGTADNWRSITAINASNLAGGVTERNRGGVISTTVVSKTAPYAGLGFEDYVTYEADYAAKTFEDVKADAVEGLLRSLMIYEEKTILGGNATLALGTTPTPTIADVTTGGVLLANTAYHCICVALTLEGFLTAVQPSTPFPGAGSIQGQVTRTDADGHSTVYGGGSAQQSVSATVTTANDSSNTHQISAYVTPVVGAYAYAWFLGTTSGTEKLNVITTINSAVMGQLNSTGQLASAIPNPSADNSENATVFDGMLSQIANVSSSGSIITTLPTGTLGAGTPLSANGSVGITEIDTILKAMWDKFNLGPTHMFVNSQELVNISKKILQSGSSGAYRLNAQAADANGAIVGNALVSEYLNQFSYDGNKVLKIMLHPNMPAGTILFYCDKIPYPLSNVGNPIKMKMRRDYYQIEWPPTKRSYDYGVYEDGHLQVVFTPAFALLTNIGNG